MISPKVATAPKRCPPRWQTYKLTNSVNGKFYIGYTGDQDARMSGHRKQARDGGKSRFSCAIRKHAWKSFEFSTLAYYDTEAEAAAGEIVAIAALRSQLPTIGYNMHPGGIGGSKAVGEEVHARPEYKAYFKASGKDRARKAADTRAREKAAGQWVQTSYGAATIKVDSRLFTALNPETPKLIWRFLICDEAGSVVQECDYYGSEADARYYANIAMSQLARDYLARMVP